METESDILDLLRAESIEAERKAQRALIIQPGAIGDSILTLPLAAFIKDSLRLGGIDVLGHTEYVGILPGRTCINRVSSIDSVDLHRLFVEPKVFNLADGDPLMQTFVGYSWIVTFMGEPGSNFEQNLIFTANCSHSTEVITLVLKPPEDSSEHLIDFYIKQFIMQSGLQIETQQAKSEKGLIQATKADMNNGAQLLTEMGLEPDEKLVVIQPGSGASKKCWHIDNFLAVAKELRSQGMKVMFLLGPAEMEKFSSTKIKKFRSAAKCLKEMPISQVLRLLCCVDLFIGNDSGITHLAAMLGVRTVAVFGPTRPDVYKPIGADVTVFEDNSPTFSEKPSPKLQQQLIDSLIK